MDKYPMDRSAQLPLQAQADARTRLVLQAALAMLVPLARWLVRNGVHYASFAPALKSVFLEAARRELADSGGKLTDSALSVLSGVHRRDIRALAQGNGGQAAPKTPSVASQVFTRWITDSQLRDGADQPMALPKNGVGLSFESLARQISSDVHPRTLLSEMQRMGLVHVEGEQVHLDAQAFVPQRGFDDMVELFAANVSDHVAAAVHNMGSSPDKYLEQSVFASGLSARSTQALGKEARRLWRVAFQQMAREAGQRLQQDQKNDETAMRMRFGVYYYAEAISASNAEPTRSAGTRARAPARSIKPQPGSK
jgi:hypothetical protein